MTFKKILKICSVFILLTIIFASSLHLSQAQTSATSTTSNFIDYKNISSFDGSQQTTKIESAGTNGVNGLVNHLLFYGVIVITALVIFRILYGGFLKGTYDNIYDQNKGKQSIKVAGFALLILIFSYAVLSFINPRLTGWSLAVNNFKINVPNNSLAANIAGLCKIDTSYNQMSIADEIKYDEQGSNFASTAYQDTANNHNVTIGWGFNLEQNNAENYLKSANIDQTKINSLLTCAKDKNTSECPTLTQSEADSIFQVSVTNAQNIATAWANKNNANGYNSLPTNIQKVLVNMAYNMGSFASFKDSGDTRQGLDKIISGDKTGIDQMAKGVATADYCGQVKNRCSRILGLIYSAYGGSCPAVTSSQSLSGSNSCVKLAESLTASDLVSLTQNGIPCDESGNNPNRCTVSKNYLPTLVALNNAYKQKFGHPIDITSSYRNQAYQQNVCSETTGACATSCSNHMTGEAVDLSNATIGDCKKEQHCTSAEFEWLKQQGSALNIPFYNNLGDTDNVHWSYNGH